MENMMLMKSITKYALFCGCILALSACSHKQLDPPAPEIEVDKTAPISFSTGILGTKGLIEKGANQDDALDDTDTRIKVYDYMKVGNPEAEVLYIENTIAWNSADRTGAWKYMDPVNATYYWTKTGTHKFFGYLTTAPDGLSFPEGKTEWIEKDETLNPKVYKTLTVGPLTLTSADADQFDFLYSDIQSYTMPARPSTDNGYVALNFSHLFTALAVKVSNQTGEQISDLSVKFLNFQNGRSATIDYSGAAVDTTMTYGSKGLYDFGGSYTDPKNESFVSLYSPDEYRLLWQQDDLTDASIQLSYKVIETTYAEEDTAHEHPITTVLAENTATVSLKDLFKVSVTDPETQETTQIPMMQAGHKYLLNITIKLTELRFAVEVDPLKNVNAQSNPNESFYIES